ncbi:hypothetical protein CK203_098731 [Vitis vinifera]|uniref:Uncharacterized protein n=1 Tax=Vitis vinifera TaxID=29760 RepID=A0A438D6D4_VITVI|nr:hypothetical protein CK203_098731 [Vitis vinifera]
MVSEPREKTLFFLRLFLTSTTPSEAQRGDLQLFSNHRSQTPTHAPPRATLLRRPESHAPAREGAWPTFQCQASSNRLVKHRLALLSLRQASPNPALHFFGISASAGLLSTSSGLRQQLSSLAETWLCLGKASSSSPITFILCWVPTYQFMGQGYEDHLVTPEDVIADVDKAQWKKIDAQLCSAKGLYTNDIQRFYKVVSGIVHVRQQDMDLSTDIGRIASLKEEFLTLMPSLMILSLSEIRFLLVHQFHHWDDVFARLLCLSSTQTLSTDGPSVPSC